ncbi:MAG: glycosyltransferase family 2 protein, partial [Planctomycetes bacterium]|nr:glycosyltransferase family 2 protein [Planctomycetota bacterium]
GMDEAFPLDCNDADFCLKIRARGYLNVWTPLAELYHFESLTRGTAPTAERLAILQAAGQLFQERWAGIFRDGDPYYNPNLSLLAGGYQLRPDAPHIHSRAA